MDIIPGGGPDRGQSQLNIHLADAPYIECEKCNGQVFEERMMLKKVSKFMTGGSQDSIVPLQVIACAACGNINELFKPKI
jgi:hypothetical protein